MTHAFIGTTIGLLLAATAALAQASAFKSGDWGSEDGGAVVIRTDGSYDLALTDAANGASIFSQGRVVSKDMTPDGKTAVSLKPTAQTAGKTTLYVVEVAADGSAVLFVVDAAGRHQAATLKK